MKLIKLTNFLVAFKSSDVDLFIYGIESEEEANKKLEEIYNSICDALPFQAIAFRSKHAVTIVSQYPYRHVQIVSKNLSRRLFRGIFQSF